MASRLEAIASRLEAMASRLEATASRLGAMASRLEAIASSTTAHKSFKVIAGFSAYTYSSQMMQHLDSKSPPILPGLPAFFVTSHLVVVAPLPSAEAPPPRCPNDPESHMS